MISTAFRIFARFLEPSVQGFTLFLYSRIGEFTLLRIILNSDFREDGSPCLFVRDTFLFAGLRSGVKTEVGSWRLLRTFFSPAPSTLVASFKSLNNLLTFLILRAQGLQTCSDKLGAFTSGIPIFSHIEAKTQPRLPSRFDG